LTPTRRNILVDVLEWESEKKERKSKVFPWRKEKKKEREGGKNTCTFLGEEEKKSIFAEFLAKEGCRRKKRERERLLDRCNF